MNEFGKRLRGLREEKNVSQAHIANIIGVSAQMVSKLEMGKSKPSMNSLKILAVYFDVSIEFFLGLEEWKAKKQQQEYLPLLGEIAAGTPIFARENIIEYIPRIPGKPGDFCLITKGRSMEPLIMDQSIVVVEKVATMKKGTVGAFIVEGNKAVIKRFFPDYFGVVLQSENPNYEPIVISKKIWEAECMVLGRVTNVILDVV